MLAEPYVGDAELGDEEPDEPLADSAVVTGSAWGKGRRPNLSRPTADVTGRFWEVRTRPGRFDHY